MHEEALWEGEMACVEGVELDGGWLLVWRAHDECFSCLEKYVDRWMFM